MQGNPYAIETGIGELAHIAFSRIPAERVDALPSQSAQHGVAGVEGNFTFTRESTQHHSYAAKVCGVRNDDTLFVDDRH